MRVERIESLESAREQWVALAEHCPNIFSTWEWADAWWRAYGAGEELELRACRRDDGELAAILPLYRMSRRLPRVLRYIGHGPADLLGPVGAPGDAALAADAMRRELEGLRPLELFLAERIAGDALAQPLAGTVIHTDSTHKLRFEGSFDEFLSSRSRNLRQQIRRRERRLSDSGRVTFRLADAATLDDDMTALFRLHQARWGEAMSTAFTPQRQHFHRLFAQLALERGWLRLWVLELDGRPVAAWYGFRYAGAEWYYQSGRDPAFDRESVGFVLLVHTIRETLDDGLVEYHLLRGDEPYKARFANVVDPVVTIAVARRPMSWAVALGARSWARLSPAVKQRARRALEPRG